MMPDGHERLEELLVQRVIGDIAPDEERELARLVSCEPGADPAGWEYAAAELTAALMQEPEALEPMPQHLAGAVVDRGQAVIASAARVTPSGVVDIATRRPRRLTSWTGWAVAAAAVLVLVLLPRGGGPVLPPSASVLRDSLVSTDAGALQAAWTATEDAAGLGASGDVVWSDREQAGVMRIRGLRPNDPSRSQYQLWIFDAARDDRFPVDGGVFDIPAGQDEVLVPIDTRLPVSEVTLFAVTVERPGGVVVSDRERVVLVAQVTG